MFKPAGLVITEALFGLPSNVCARFPRVICAVPCVLVSVNAAAGDSPPILAVTLYGPPAIRFAMNAGAVATPPASVDTVALPENEPLGPSAGGVKLTRIPLVGRPDSVTVACKEEAKVLLIAADC